MQIWFEDRPVATLVPGQYGPSLAYERGWRELPGAFPVSTRMPFRADPYPFDTVLPWIVNLLPEERNLELVARLTGVGAQDVLGLLTEIGRDTSGALSFAARGSTRMAYRAVETPDALERILNELPSKPFLVGDEGVSMSLAGVQAKIGVYLDDDSRICIPIDGSPSTWILKPDSRNLWGGVFNEAFCLTLARNVGLATPDIRIGQAGERKYLLVARYDRRRQDQAWRRLHQEDFCQALGIFPSSKYERNQTGTSGPKVRDMIAATREAGDLSSVLRLMEYVIFNIIACNTDAHAKNYSLLITGAGASLTPIYDVMCGAVWPNVTINLSNTIAGKNRGDYLKGRHWQREALICGLNPRVILALVGRLCERADAALDTSVEQIAKLDPAGEGMAELCRDEIRKRITFLINGLKETDPDLKGWAADNLRGGKR